MGRQQNVSTEAIPLGETGAFATLTARVEEVAVLAELPSVTIPLPAGRWRVTASIAAEPADSAPPPATATTEVRFDRDGKMRTEALALRAYRALDRDGAVRFVIAVETGDGRGYAEARGSIPLDRVAEPRRAPLWGAHLHTFIPRDRPKGSLDPFLDSVRDLGMDIIRTSFPWAFLQPDGPAFDTDTLDKADAVIAACAERGMRVLIDLGCHRPAWSTGPGWDEYGDCVARCLDRWGVAVAAIETMNEPNVDPRCFDPALTIPEVFALAARRDPRKPYFRLDDVVGAAAAARHAIANEVPCLGPALAGADVEYLRALYQHGLADAVDAVSCHPYAMRFDAATISFRPPEQPWGDLEADGYHLVSGLDAVRQVMAEFGDAEKHVWVTEYGYSTGTLGPNGSGGFVPLGADEQAAWLATAMRQAAAISYLDAFLIYLAYDNPWSGIAAQYARPDNFSGWFADFGLVDNTNQPKPSYLAVAETIATLP